LAGGNARADAAGGVIQITELVLPRRLSVMGYVDAKNANPKRLEVFKQGLAELGYIEGKNVRIEYREVVLDAEYHGAMTDLVGRSRFDSCGERFLPRSPPPKQPTLSQS